MAVTQDVIANVLCSGYAVTQHHCGGASLHGIDQEQHSQNSMPFPFCQVSRQNGGLTRVFYFSPRFILLHTNFSRVNRALSNLFYIIFFPSAVFFKIFCVSSGGIFMQSWASREMQARTKSSGHTENWRWSGIPIKTRRTLKHKKDFRIWVVHTRFVFITIPYHTLLRPSLNICLWWLIIQLSSRFKSIPVRLQKIVDFPVLVYCTLWKSQNKRFNKF